MPPPVLLNLPIDYATWIADWVEKTSLGAAACVNPLTGLPYMEFGIYPYCLSPTGMTTTNLGGRGGIYGFVNFGWNDDRQGNSPYGLPWVRSVWRERTFRQVDFDWLIPGRKIGIRVRTDWTLDTPPGVPGRVFLELQATGYAPQRAVIENGSFNLWTLDPAPNVVDFYLFTTVPASGEITVLVGAQDLFPSMNMLCAIIELEAALIEEAPVVEEPPPDEPPPPPIPPREFSVCSIFDILYRAQEEAGYRFHSMEDAAGVLTRYAKQLLSRCMASWYGNEVGDLEYALQAVIGSGGWGWSWGTSWGAGLGSLVPANFGLPLPRTLEAIWRIEAREITTGSWITVNLVKPDDEDGAADPRCLVADRELKLLTFATAWAPFYDAVRIRGTSIHPTPVDWYVSIEPNVHIGPLFCRACELHMARDLSIKAADIRQATKLSTELASVTASLLSQSRSQEWIETVRFTRR